MASVRRSRNILCLMNEYAFVHILKDCRFHISLILVLHYKGTNYFPKILMFNQNNASIHLHSPSPQFILQQLPNLVRIAKRKHESIDVDTVFLGHLDFSWDISLFLGTFSRFRVTLPQTSIADDQNDAPSSSYTHFLFFLLHS